MLMKLIFCFFLAGVSIVTCAQNKKKQKTSAEKKQTGSIVRDEDVKIDTLSKYDIPPETKELEDTRIDVVSALPPMDTTSPPDDDFTRDILKLLTITKAEESDVKMAELSLKQSLGSDTSAVMGEFYRRFVFEIREGRARKLLRNLYVNSYRGVYTQDDIKSLILFYQTPLGQNLLNKTPILVQKVMVEAQNIGRYLGTKLMREVLEDEKQH